MEPDSVAQVAPGVVLEDDKCNISSYGDAAGVPATVAKRLSQPLVTPLMIAIRGQAPGASQRSYSVIVELTKRDQ